jgi:hypothetical protein
MAWGLGCLLPAIPFCHSGLEVAEMMPVNTGLDFTPEELPHYSQEKLALFSAVAYGWENEPNLVEWIARTLELRARYTDLIADPEPSTFRLLESDDPMVWAVVRQRGDVGIAVVVNLDPEKARRFSLSLPTSRPAVQDLLTGESLPLREGCLEAEWPPCGCRFLGVGSREYGVWSRE